MLEAVKILSLPTIYLLDLFNSQIVCSWFSGINPFIGFDPSIFELSIFIRGKGKNE